MVTHISHTPGMLLSHAMLSSIQLYNLSMESVDAIAVINSITNLSTILGDWVFLFLLEYVLAFVR